MTLQGDYAPSAAQWVRDQVEAYERSGGQQANTLRDTGLPVIIVTMWGNKSGKVRKIALMRVEHNGDYALVASMGGAPKHPVWYYNLKANPDQLTIQDGPEPFEAIVREVTGDERAEWWERAVAAYPPYAEYQRRTDRQIPVFVTSPQGAAPGAVASTAATSVFTAATGTPPRARARQGRRSAGRRRTA